MRTFGTKSSLLTRNVVLPVLLCPKVGQRENHTDIVLYRQGPVSGVTSRRQGR